jgi:hypothetical protein
MQHSDDSSIETSQKMRNAEKGWEVWNPVRFFMHIPQGHQSALCLICSPDIKYHVSSIKPMLLWHMAYGIWHVTTTIENCPQRQFKYQVSRPMAYGIWHMAWQHPMGVWVYGCMGVWVYVCPASAPETQCTRFPHITYRISHMTYHLSPMS